MPASFDGKLVVAISSRALFDLEESNRVFEERGVEAYYQYQREHENEMLAPPASRSHWSRSCSG